jgi:hypothetical protein
MSADADLLNRAVEVLERRYKATTPAPWVVERYSHTLDDGHTWRINGPTGDDMVTPCALETRTEAAEEFRRAEADAAYAELMHPPVAVALACWLFSVAVDEKWEPETAPRIRERTAALAVARAVLREPEVKA